MITPPTLRRRVAQASLRRALSYQIPSEAQNSKYFKIALFGNSLVTESKLAIFFKHQNDQVVHLSGKSLSTSTNMGMGFTYALNKGDGFFVTGPLKASGNSNWNSSIIVYEWGAGRKRPVDKNQKCLILMEDLDGQSSVIVLGGIA